MRAISPGPALSRGSASRSGGSDDVEQPGLPTTDKEGEESKEGEYRHGAQQHHAGVVTLADSFKIM